MAGGCEGPALSLRRRAPSVLEKLVDARRLAKFGRMAAPVRPGLLPDARVCIPPRGQPLAGATRATVRVSRPALRLSRHSALRLRAARSAAFRPLGHRGDAHRIVSSRRAAARVVARKPAAERAVRTRRL